MTVGTADNSHLNAQAEGRERRHTGDGTKSLETSKPTQWHKSSNKATPLNPSQTVPSTGNQSIQVYEPSLLKLP